MMVSDQDLITQFQSNKQREFSFTQLVSRHQHKLYYQIKRMVQEHADTDDITQIAWMKVWDKLDGFKMESEFSTWLFRIGYNETINYINKQKKTSRLNNLDLSEENSITAISTNDPKPSQIQIKLDTAIKQLPEKQRFVFMLRYYEEMNYEKIANITGTTIGGAKANYHQAIKKLQEIVSKD